MPNTLSPDDTVDLTSEDGARLHTAAIQLAKEGASTAADHAEQAAAAMELLGALIEWHHHGSRSRETRYLIELGLSGLRDCTSFS